MYPLESGTDAMGGMYTVADCMDTYVGLVSRGCLDVQDCCLMMYFRLKSSPSRYQYEYDEAPQFLYRGSP